MRGGILLLLAGILLAYLGASGKYRCFTVFAKCVAGDGNCDCNSANIASAGTSQSPNSVESVGSALKLPALPKLPTQPIIRNIYG